MQIPRKRVEYRVEFAGADWLEKTLNEGDGDGWCLIQIMPPSQDVDFCCVWEREKRERTTVKEQGAE